MAENTAKDDKTASASSTEAKTDVKSSTSAPSSETTTSSGEVAKTAVEVATEAYKKATAAEEAASTSSEDEGAESETIIAPDQETETTDGETEDFDSEGETDESESEAEGDETDLPPFHKHPRFQELVKERNTYKEQLDKQANLVAAHQSVIDYCQQNDVSPSEFEQFVRLAALVKTDPAQARKELEPIWSELGGVVGEGGLPEDLQAEVDADELSLERAKEIAALRAQNKLKESQKARTAEQMRAQQQRAFIAAIQNGVAAWETAKAESDPGFRPKTKESDKDGKYEWFMDKLAAMIQRTPPKTVNEAVQIAESAYQAVNGSIERFVPKQPTKKVLTSTNSSTHKKGPPVTALDAALAAARKAGVLK